MFGFRTTRWLSDLAKIIKLPIYIEPENVMATKVFEVYGPEFPKGLRLKWLTSLSSRKVTKGEAVCTLVDKDNFKTNLYSPAYGWLIKRLPEGEIATEKLLCHVKQERAYFKKHIHRLNLPAGIFAGVGKISVFKGTGFIVNEGEKIAVITDHKGQHFEIISPYNGVLTAIHAKDGDVIAPGNIICTLSEFSKSILPRVKQKIAEYKQKYKNYVPPFFFVQSDRKLMETKEKPKTDPYITITNSVDMRAALKTAALASMNHDLKPLRVITCVYIKALSQVLKNYPSFARPPHVSNFALKDSIDITLALFHEGNEAFPTLRGVEKMSLVQVYWEIEKELNRHLQRRIRDTWSDDFTFVLSDAGSSGVFFMEPGIKMSALATLSCNSILPTTTYQSDGSSFRLVNCPMMCMSLTYDERLTNYNGEGAIMLSKLKELIEFPLRLL